MTNIRKNKVSRFLFSQQIDIFARRDEKSVSFESSFNNNSIKLKALDDAYEKCSKLMPYSGGLFYYVFKRMHEKHNIILLTSYYDR